MSRVRRLGTAVAIVSLLALTGCGSVNYGARTPSPESSSAPQSTTPAEYILGQWLCRLDATGSNRMNLTFNVSEDVIELTQQDENGDHLVQDAVRYEITGNVLTTTPRQGEGIAIELPETVDFEGVNRARAVQPDREIAIEVEVDQNSALVTVEGSDSPMDCTRVSN